jgi:hypothetical protein
MAASVIAGGHSKLRLPLLLRAVSAPVNPGLLSGGYLHCSG